MPEPNHRDGFCANGDLRLDSSRVETRQGLQDLSRFVYIGRFLSAINRELARRIS